MTSFAVTAFSLINIFYWNDLFTVIFWQTLGVLGKIFLQKYSELQIGKRTYQWKRNKSFKFGVKKIVEINHYFSTATYSWSLIVYLEVCTVKLILEEISLKSWFLRSNSSTWAARCELIKHIEVECRSNRTPTPPLFP